MSIRVFDLTFSKMIGLHLRKHFSYYAVAILALTALHWIQVQIPQLIVVIKSEVEEGQSFYLILKFVGIALGVIVCRTISRWFFFYPARLQQRDLRNELLERLSLTNPAQWRHHLIGKLYQLLGSDLDQIRAFVGFAMLQLINLIIALIVMVPAMNKLNADLFVALIPLGVTFIIFSFSVFFSTKLSEQTTKHHDVLQQMLIEFFDAKKTLNTFCREESAAIEFSQQSQKELHTFFLTNIFRSWTRPLLILGGSLSTIYAAWLVHQLHLPLSFLLAYGAFIFMLQEPLGYLTWIGVVATDTFVSWKRLKALTKDLVSQLKPIEPNSNNHLSLQLKFHEKNIQLDLFKNRRVLMCGPTGGGKTTLINALHQASLAQGFSAVFVAQEPYLFNQTLSENLLLGQTLTAELEKKILHLLTIFELDELAAPHELLNLRVGENGKRLSGGQIKRLHLVRSLLHHYDVLLWDDPFSSVDVLTEKRMMDHLLKEKFFENKILLMSSHRLSTVKYADEIIFCSKHDFILDCWQTNVELQEKLQVFFAAKLGRHV